MNSLLSLTLLKLVMLLTFPHMYGDIAGPDTTSLIYLSPSTTLPEFHNTITLSHTPVGHLKQYRQSRIQKEEKQ